MDERVPGEVDVALSQRTRQASIVILVAMAGWLVGSWFGGLLGLPSGLAFLMDLACLGALVWSIAALLKVWRARQEMKD